MVDVPGETGEALADVTKNETDVFDVDVAVEEVDVTVAPVVNTVLYCMGHTVEDGDKKKVAEQDLKMLRQLLLVQKPDEVVNRLPVDPLVEVVDN